MKKNQIVTIVVILVVAAGSFLGGLKFGQNKKQNNFFGNANFRQMAGGVQNGLNGNKNIGVVNGEIIANDGKSLTVKLRDGGSKILFFSEATTISKNATGTSEDLVMGENVMATGKTNSDGSMTVETIQLRQGGFIIGGQRGFEGNQPALPMEQK